MGLTADPCTATFSDLHCITPALAAAHVVSVSVQGTLYETPARSVTLYPEEACVLICVLEVSSSERYNFIMELLDVVFNLWLEPN
jgi:hypothetical protein